MAVKKLAKVTDHLLRDLLWDAMNKVYSGEMEHKQGAVVAKTAGQILNIEKVRIAMHKAGLLVNRKDLLEK
ncbi:MAG: hypothetical protein V3R57_06345 [Candidatus Bathyarchaeia archaeon]